MDELVVISLTPTIGCLHSGHLTIHVDSKFRLFTVALNLNACHNGTDSFYKASHWLLDQIGETNQYEDFLKFFSLMRNTIHHNGRYVSKDYPNESATYRGITYNFVSGQPVKYSNLNNLLYLEITSDVIDMMQDTPPFSP